MHVMEVFMHRFSRSLRIVLSATALCASGAWAATPAEQLGALTAQAGRSPNVAQGQQFFNATHGREWSCASCHNAVPTGDGKHASTGKTIAPLAPGFNPQRFTDVAKSEKWFRRNCNDVLARECTAAEKADVLAWLVSLKR
jgi:cytochrome c peroxidase